MPRLKPKDRIIRRALSRTPVYEKIERKKSRQAEAAPETVNTTLDPAIAAAERFLEQASADHPLKRHVLDRLKKYRECERKKDRQDEERERCKRDKAYFLEWYCWTFDPRIEEGPRVLPFVPWDKQKDFLSWIDDRRKAKKEGAVEKSRDAGATYLACAYSIHAWSFENDFSAGFGSRKEDLVDQSENTNTIFFKLRSILYRLPAWLMPVGFSARRHDLYMRLANPETGSSIIGEGGDNIGRGGRVSIYFVDEAAFVMRAELADRALAGTTDVIVWISTVNGVGNVFYKKVHSRKLSVFVFDWRDDPRKNYYELRGKDGQIASTGHGRPNMEHLTGIRLVYPWYEAKKAEKDEVLMAQEYDRDYAASMEGALFEAKWLQAAVGLRIPPTGFLAAGHDIAESVNRSTYAIRDGGTIRKIYSWKLSQYKGARKAIQLSIDEGIGILFYDRGGGFGGSLAGQLADIGRKKNMYNGVRVTFEAFGVIFGGNATSRRWEDQRRSKDFIDNRRTEEFYVLAQRFKKTYEYVHEGAGHKIDDLISLPNDGSEEVERLIRQLSSLIVETTEDGKLILESKKAAKKRGIDSPDEADAVVLSFWTKPPEDEAPPAYSFRSY